ncbi:hypothetical protein Mmah_1014 [Methanohalophilus mahii DSM 5219]|uniref:GCN5-related N-acetyltransferase n=1 Tax=Methanohalophilus mahii (strain ATCC 35705 / DSM 5219 / SLP) TaxID=547558 RepID=D5EBI1_METMS|nr:hypothetical protein Mmah_1014 [Methanohalophilus mahii DSM 5219]
MVEIRWTEGIDGFNEVYQVRRKVFIGEQNVPEELKSDENDPIARHITIFDKNKPIAIGRLFEKIICFTQAGYEDLPMCGYACIWDNTN